MTRVGRFLTGEVRVQEPLAPLTSIRVGGAAELFVRPKRMDDLLTLLKLVRSEGVPLTVLGGGNNTLVGDGGVKGLTLKLPVVPELIEPTDDGGRLTFGAGAAISRLIVRMKEHGWVGAEALAGIPGTLGGAVRMNAGTKNGECMASVEAVEVATADGIGWIDRSQLTYGYRHTELPPDGVVTRVRFSLQGGDAQASLTAMEQDLAYRKRTQPLSQPNFGSVFQNPLGGHAGRLIESVRLKGHQIGGAAISQKHANWIVNLGGAAASDVTSLMELMQQRVRDAHGITLHPEVQRIGVFL
jgi:UDP-N-acetylmuramate dehydrogenase